ncbi:MAG TPA: outer membrane lipid asymmetry maintenance protein MlaD [Syntrophales bacterium]|nr:outer membrane lipid asymmetry maintenance protein MlaD [Syntrophales bacterium]HRT70945.1 outer membrane lipid asymmetry maintenance protein MlaD [Syntrophales bacterium]
MKKYTMETTVGIFVVIGLLAIAYMTVKLGHVSFLVEDTYPLYAKFTTVAGLRPGNYVEMYGIEVGRVERLTMDQENGLAVVELRINNGVKVYGDAVVSIKTEGLIGDRYVHIDPGGAAEELKPGETITETQAPVDILDLIGKYVFGGVKTSEEPKKEDKP